MRQIKTVVISLCLTITFNNVIAQDVEWLVKPVISDVDDIMLKDDLTDIIMVKKDRLWGVRNDDNDVILPCNFKKVDIRNNGQYLWGFNDGEDRFFDNEGHSITSESVMSFERNTQKKKNLDKISEQIAAIEKNLTDVTITKESTSNRTVYHLISIYGDTILKNQILLNRIESFLGRFVKYYDKDSDKSIIIDSEGRKIDEQSGFRTSVLVDEAAGVFGINFNSNEAKVYDKNGQLIFEVQQFEPMEAIPYFKVKLGGLEYLINETHSKVFRQGASLIRQIEDADWVYGSTENKSMFYNTKTGEKYESPYVVTGNYNPSIVKVELGQMKGAFDLQKKVLIVPLEYRHLEYHGNHFVAGIQHTNPKEKNTIAERKILNSNGEVIYKNNCIDIGYLDGIFIIHESDRSFTLIDGNLNILKKYPVDTRIKTNKTKNGWLINRSYGGAHYFSYDLKKHVDRDFQEIGDSLDANGNHAPLYIAKYKGYWGALNDKGETVIPFSYDSIKPYRSSNKENTQLLIADRRGKKGIMKRP